MVNEYGLGSLFAREPRTGRTPLIRVLSSIFLNRNHYVRWDDLVALGYSVQQPRRPPHCVPYGNSQAAVSR
jgi:hypothetical protein